ncbi:testis-expressed protein 47-like isoform X3 [Pomacea canaliculata]|uniref:testis-expressed protein 47-like isoform X3 n=1 Tax=Pomacea canaliculata TaxID=400727 RepID=UPI000D7343EC|nr:testis-expressed protein 47-like isoform X3 [Pomacea canaliculata]
MGDSLKMANEEGALDDPLFESERTSLLEVIEERNRSLSKKNLIHRVFFISRLGESVINRTDVGNYYELFIKRLKNDFQTEPITGLMLIYMKYVVHVMESSADMILELAKEMAEEEKRPKGHFMKSKILIISHDITVRQYQSWNFRTLDIVEPGIEAYEPGESTENLVIELLTQLLRLGNFLAKQPKLNLKNAMDSLHDKVPELLPQQAVVHFLLEENDPCMMTPSEYVEMHTSPFDIILDSDLVWPLPTRLFPYN